MKPMPLILSAAVLLVALPQVATADDTTLVSDFDVDPGARTHDGFFLRMSAGLGGSNILAEPDSGGDQEITGSMGTFELSVGGALTENLILHGTVNTMGMSDANFSGQGDAFEGEYDEVGIGFVGVGVTYYIMPANVYVSSSIGANGIYLNGNDEDSDREMDSNGAGLIVQVGKEWWVSDNWGLGLAAQTHLGGLAVEDSGGDVDWGYFNYGLVLSATYN